MSGTKAGSVKAKKTLFERHGEDFFARIGSKGGKVKGPKGFALMDAAKRAEAGRKGGTISRRGPALKPKGWNDDETILTV